MPFFGGGGGGGGPAIYKYVNTTNIAGGTGALAAVTGNNNMGLGKGAVANLLNADGNIAIGFQACPVLLTGAYNVVIGPNAGAQLNAGSNNIFIGETAGSSFVNGVANIVIGDGAGWNGSGGSGEEPGASIAIGGSAAIGANGGTSIGQDALADNYGIAIGGNSNSGWTTTSATGSAGTGGRNAIAIGNGATATDDGIAIGSGVTAANNQIVIGDSSYTDGITIGGVAYPPAASIGAAPITGMAISWTSATVINVAAGNAVINGVMHAFGAATLTSGSTMTDLNGAAVTLAANKAYHVYAWNNGGTLQFAVQNWSDATYGGTPVYDLANDYFKSPYATVGLNARRIGKFWTNGSGNILEFWQEGLGRNRRTEFLNAVQILSTGNSASLVTVGTLTPYSTLDDDNIIVGLNYVNGGTFQALAYLTPDSAGAALMEFSAISLGGSPNYANNIVMPNIGALYYKIVGGATTLNLFLSGFMEYI